MTRIDGIAGCSILCFPYIMIVGGIVIGLGHEVAGYAIWSTMPTVLAYLCIRYR